MIWWPPNSELRIRIALVVEAREICKACSPPQAHQRDGERAPDGRARQERKERGKRPSSAKVAPFDDDDDGGGLETRGAGLEPGELVMDAAQPTTVRINVYDISPANQYTTYCGVGIFHTGVEAFGIEFAYGGHPNDTSGIFATRRYEAPGDVKFRQTIEIGLTRYTRKEVDAIIQSLGEKYTGQKYHLLLRNCNHFADEFVSKLTGKQIPLWINRLAHIAVSIHWIIPVCLLPDVSTITVFNETYKEDEKQCLLRDKVSSSGPGTAINPGKRRSYEKVPNFA